MKLCKVVIVLTCFQTRKPQLREVKQFGKFVKMANLEREGVQPPCTPPPLGRGYMTWGRCDLEQRKWHLTLELAPRPGFFGRSWKAHLYLEALLLVTPGVRWPQTLAVVLPVAKAQCVLNDWVEETCRWLISSSFRWFQPPFHFYLASDPGKLVLFSSLYIYKGSWLKPVILQVLCMMWWHHWFPCLPDVPSLALMRSLAFFHSVQLGEPRWNPVLEAKETEGVG